MSDDNLNPSVMYVFSTSQLNEQLDLYVAEATRLYPHREDLILLVRKTMLDFLTSEEFADKLVMSPANKKHPDSFKPLPEPDEFAKGMLDV